MLQIAQFLQHLEKELQWFRKACDALFKRRYIIHDKFIFQVTIVGIIVIFFCIFVLHCTVLMQVTKRISYYILYYFQNSVFIAVDLEDKHERCISTEQFYFTSSCSRKDLHF